MNYDKKTNVIKFPLKRKKDNKLEFNEIKFYRRMAHNDFLQVHGFSIGISGMSEDIEDVKEIGFVGGFKNEQEAHNGAESFMAMILLVMEKILINQL